MNMVEKVAAAIDGVRLFSRVNDWASDRVEGLPIEICRYGDDDEDEIIVIKRFPLGHDEGAALAGVVSETRARAAIKAMRETDAPRPYQDRAENDGDPPRSALNV